MPIFWRVLFPAHFYYLSVAYLLLAMPGKCCFSPVSASAFHSFHYIPPLIITMHIDGLDHLVLTVRDIEATCSFYSQILGMAILSFGEGRKALGFGQQKINLHLQNSTLSPKATVPTPGSADLCFLTTVPMATVIHHITSQGLSILAGPIERTGATGKLLSIYIRDPDGNLIEISNQM